MARPSSPGLTGALTLTATMGVSALFTSGVSWLGPASREDLGLSRVELGLFSMVVFLTAASRSIPPGILSDHLPPRVGIAMTFLIAMLGMICAVFAPSLPTLIFAAAAGGCSLALSASATNKAVGEYVQRSRRGRVLSTERTGVQFAQFIAGFLFPAVAVVFGWRGGLACGAVVILLALILIFLTTNQAFVQRVVTPVTTVNNLTTSSRGNSWLLKTMVFYALVTAVCFQSNLFGFPLMGYEALDLDVQETSKVVVILGAVGFVSRLVWGRYADRQFRIWVVILMLGIGLLIEEATVFLAAFTRVQWVLWIGAVVVGTFFALVPVVSSAVILQNFPAKRVGVTSGVISVCTFGGFAIGPLLFDCHCRPLELSTFFTGTCGGCSVRGGNPVAPKTR